MRTWICLERPDAHRGQCAVWIELNSKHMLWILDSGKHGVTYSGDLPDRLERDSGSWRRL